MKKTLNCIAVVLLSGATAFAGTVYLDSSNGDLWAGDPTSATYNYVGNSGHAFADIDFARGVLYGIDATGNLYSINTSNAAANFIGNTGLGAFGVVGLAGDSGGELWAGGNNTMFKVDPGSANAHALSCNGTTCGGYTTSGDLDFIGNGSLWLIAVNGGGGGDFLVSINQTTGFGTNAGTLPFSSVFGVAYDSDNGIFYGYDSAFTQFDINTATPSSSGSSVTFNVTGEPGGTGSLLGAAFITASPEPSSIGLGLLGVGMIAAILRRNKI